MISPRKHEVATVRAGFGEKQKRGPKPKLVPQKTKEEVLVSLIEEYNRKKGLGGDFYIEDDSGTHTVPGYVTSLKMTDGYGVYRFLDSDGLAEPIIKKIYTLEEVIIFFEGLLHA